MVTPVRADCSAGGGHRRGQIRAPHLLCAAGISFIEKLGGHKAVEAEAFACFGPAHGISAVIGSEGEGGGLALLEGQVLSERDIHGTAEDGYGTRILSVEGQLRDLQICSVALIESSHGTGTARQIRRTQVATRQTVAIEGVHGKLINVEPAAKPSCHEEEHGNGP